MTEIENLSVVIMEECAELAQAISKSLRFGYDCYDESIPETNNASDILIEYYQLKAMMELLISRAKLYKYGVDEETQKLNKISKFLKYEEISKELGKIT